MWDWAIVGLAVELVAGEKSFVSWSGGKDSALALHEILEGERYEVLGLLTTLSIEFDGISIHGVRSLLLEQQARSLGFPLEKMLIPNGVSNEEYEASLLRVLAEGRKKGISSVVFGDIFLQDVKEYRERLLSRAGLKSVFPLWKKDTRTIAQSFVDLGFKAVLTVVDSNFLGQEFAGREFDEKLLVDFPSNVDPCGENGEFHTFVYDGPIFGKRVRFVKGEVVFRENRFYYCDLIPATTFSDKSNLK